MINNKKFKSILFCLISITIIATIQCGYSTKQDEKNLIKRNDDQKFAFVGVNVIPMTNEEILENQVVIVENGIITKIGDEKNITISNNMKIIKPESPEPWYLMPGLSDMHTHVGFNTESDREVKNDLILYLTNGVTTILNMGDNSGKSPFIKRAIEKGEIHGPTMYIAHYARGREDGGSTRTVAETELQASKLVENAESQGYDMIKVYNSLKTNVFDTIVAKAKSLDMPVVGHGVREPGMEYILRNGLSMVAHAEEFCYTSFNNKIDTSKITPLTELLIKSKTFVTTTFSTYEIIAKLFNANTVNMDSSKQEYLSQDGVDFLSEERINLWKDAYLNAYSQNTYDLFPILDFQQKFIKDFYEAGVPILLGSDSPVIPGMAPGFSLIRDLELCIDAGLSPYQALYACTTNPGKFINQSIKQETPFGKVKEGYRADLLLLKENPLDDIRHIRSIVGVMVKGNWYSEKNIRNLQSKLIQN